MTDTSDVFDMASAYNQKVSYYYDEDVLRWAAKRWPGHRLSINAVVFNWRGAIYRHSAGFMKQLGIKDFDLKVMSVRILTYIYSC